MTARSQVRDMAKHLHTLLRNGKETPYADDEEQRYYELIITSLLAQAEAVVLTENDAEELAKLLYVRGAKLATKAAIAREIIRTLIATREGGGSDVRR